MLAAAAEVWKDRLEGTGPKGQVPRDRSCAPRSGVGGLMDPTDPPSAGPRSAVMDPADPPGAGPRRRVMGPANDGGAGSGGASEASTSAGPPDGERLVPVVEGLSIEVALTLAADEARALQTVALPEGDGLQVVLASRDGEGAWVEHARARVRTGAAPRGRSEAPARVRARCPRRRDGDEHRAALRARGIELGAAFAGIVALWSGPGEVLAEIRAPASIARALPLSLAHPALLDACVQTFGAAAAGDDDDGAAWLPVGFGALACAPDLAERAAEGPLWCHTRVRARTSGSLEGSLALVDADGRPLLTLDGFVARRADPGALAGEQDTYALRWTPRPVPTPASAAGAWLVAGAGPLAGAIADALASAGGRCVQVSAAPDARAEALLDAPIRGVLLVAEEGPVADAASAAPTRPADPGPADALAWAQRLAGRGARDVPRLWIVTCGAQATRAGEGASPGLAALWGLARALRHELPELRCAAVDLPAARDPASDPFGRAISGDEPLADPLDPAAASLRYATSGEEPLADPLDPAAASLRRAISSEDPLADPPDPDLPIAALVGLLTGDDPEDEWALRGGEGLVPRLIPWSRRGSGRWRARGDGTYLVTGGLGGLGGATAAWLVERGARHLALVGRSAPGPAADAVIADLRRQGAQVEVLRVDVADPEAWSRAAAGLARSAPPVVGVVHGAGVLDDGVALQQDAARMARVLRPKLDGGEALDRWAAGAELFVAFGSTAGLLGELAQAPYAAANAALTALAHRRRRAGRHALTVDWGPWAEVGRAAGGAGGRGYRPMTPARALQALEALLVDDATHAVVASLDLRQWREVHLPVASTPLLADLEAAPPPGRRADVDAQRAALAALAPGPRRARVVHGVQAEVGAVLRLDAAEIDPRSPLRDLGVDSLRTMELRNRLEARFGVLLTAASLWSHGQVEALAGLVLTRLGLAEAPVAATPGATASTGARHDAATPRDRQGAASDPRLAAAPGDRHADAMPDAAPFGVPGTAASRHDGAAPPGAAPPGAATPGATASTGARHDAATPRDRQGAASDPRLAAAPGDRLAAAMPGATPFGVPGTAADAAAAAPGDRHAATSDPRLAAAASDLSGTAAARPDDAALPGAAAHPGDGPSRGSRRGPGGAPSRARRAPRRAPLTAPSDHRALLLEALQEIRGLRERLAAAEAAGSEPIAIVGMSGRFPGGADDVAGYWSLLRDGRDAIAQVPRDRWDLGAYYDPAGGPGRVSCRWGGFLTGDVYGFDAPFFALSPREAAAIDPQQRLLLEVAYEALEDAGWPPSRAAGSRTGVFVGIFGADYFWLHARDPALLDAQVSLGNGDGVAAGRIAYAFDLRGPCMAVDTVCSCRRGDPPRLPEPRAGECELALAGGVNLMLAPPERDDLAAPGAALDGRCKTSSTPGPTASSAARAAGWSPSAASATPSATATRSGR
ncbi:MAG: SDR family NAD(P)-dependent oxidoreductase [Nannocystaceae bacterium]